MHETDTLEVFVNGLWVQCSMSQIDERDIFRIRKPDGELFIGEDGVTIWMCTKIPNIPCRPLPDVPEGQDPARK